MFVALGFLCSLHAEEFVLEPELCRDRAGRTNASFLLGNAHETLSNYTEKQLLCILGTFIVGRTLRAITHAFIFLHFFCQICR